MDGIGKQPEFFQSMDEFHLLMFQANPSHFSFIIMAVVLNPFLSNFSHDR